MEKYTKKFNANYFVIAFTVVEDELIFNSDEDAARDEMFKYLNELKYSIWMDETFWIVASNNDFYDEFISKAKELEKEYGAKFATIIFEKLDKDYISAFEGIKNIDTLYDEYDEKD